MCAIVCSLRLYNMFSSFFFFQAEDGIRDLTVTGVQTCALPICSGKSIAYNASAGVTTTAWFYNLSGTVTRPMFFNSSGGGTIIIGNASPQASTVGSKMTVNRPVTITNLIGGLGPPTPHRHPLER